MENFSDGGAVGVLLIGAAFDEFLVVLLAGILADVVFVAEAERTDDGQWHFSHA